MQDYIEDILETLESDSDQWSQDDDLDEISEV